MLWINVSNTLLNRLHLLQKRVIRIIAKSHYLAHTNNIFKQLRVLTVYELGRLQLGEFMYRSEKGLLPNSLQNWFRYNSDVHCYNTRNSKNLHSIYYRTATGQRSVKYQGYLTWSTLDDSLKHSASLRQFKYNINNIFAILNSHINLKTIIIMFQIAIMLSSGQFNLIIKPDI